MKKRLKVLIMIIIVGLFCLSPFFQFVKSVVVMSVYSVSEASYSLLKDEDIHIKMPGGWSTIKKDWFPFVMTFNADQGFSNYIGKETRLSILYNFGAFEYLKGASSYYDEATPYFDAFYGAYVVKGEDFTFGYNLDGTPNYSEMAEVPRYDMNALVLESIGCDYPSFDFTLEKTDHLQSFLGYEDWDVIEGTIKTQSPVHELEKNYQAYIQYGKPPQGYFEGEDFKLIEVKGKIYARYFPEKKCSIFLYVIAPNEAAVAQCDKDFLQKTKLKIGR